MSDTVSNDHRGGTANSPRAIPLAGWRDILLRTWSGIGDDHVAITAAGVAFYGLLAVFPAIAALVSIWGLIADPAEIEAQIASLSTVLPEEAASIITDQARSIASGAGAGVTFASIFGLLFAIYSTSRGVNALIEGLNIIYGEREKRGYALRLATSVALTFGAIVVALVALGFVVVVPALIAGLGLERYIGPQAPLLRWPVMAVVVLLAFAALYRLGPSRKNPRWEWVSWGAITATAVWIGASVLFSLYVRHFASYNETYGTLGGVIILLMWFWVSAFVILMGAELNAEIEHQTGLDTTVGEPRAMGERGAYVADTLGKRH